MWAAGTGRRPRWPRFFTPRIVGWPVPRHRRRDFFWCALPMTDSPIAYPETLAIRPLEEFPAATVRMPGSKSITNRALVLAALTSRGNPWALRGALRSEDTEVMIECLRALGVRVLTDWAESTVFVASAASDARIPAHRADLFVANSGTTMRFLTAVVALGHGRFRLDGVPRMRDRPIGDLLDALG